MRIERAELAVYDARAVDLLKPWQEHRVPCGDVDAIAGPQLDRMAAVLGDEAEAIPLGLEDPPLIVEGGVDECREHRPISRIPAFLFQVESSTLHSRTSSVSVRECNRSRADRTDSRLPRSAFRSRG